MRNNHNTQNNEKTQWIKKSMCLTNFFVSILIYRHIPCHVVSFTLRTTVKVPIYLSSPRQSNLQEARKHSLTSNVGRMYNMNNDKADNNDQSKENEESVKGKSKFETDNELTESQRVFGKKNFRKSRNRKEVEWNTSIFPAKVAMSPPVEKNKFAPQLYIQSIAGLIGIMTGVSVSTFKLSIDTLRQFFYDSDLVSSGLLPIFLIPVIGSVVVALIGLTGEFSPGLSGVVKEVDEESLAAQFKVALDNDISSIGRSNNDDVFQQLKYAGKSLRKSLAAIMTLGTGNSLGPEGPGVEIGTAISRLGMLLWPMDENDSSNGNGRISRNRLLLACGAAAGVSSGFNAPLSGVFFALEVVQASLKPLNVPASLPKDSDTRGISSASTTVSNIQLQQQSLSSTQGSITAILISSVLAALVAQGILGKELALELVIYEIRTPLIELPLYIVLGLSCGIVSVIFSQAAKFFKNVFSGNVGPEGVREVFSAVPAPALPVVGGLTCGFIGYFYPQVLFFGYETLNKLLEDNSIPIEMLLTLLAVKLLATAISAGSGLVGGTLAPSLFLGGMTGASFHYMACNFLTALNIPESIISSSGTDLFHLAGVPAYAMVGAASVLAAIFRAPLTASLLLFEVTRNYDVILPLLVSAGVSSLFCDIVEYKVQQASEK